MNSSDSPPAPAGSIRQSTMAGGGPCRRRMVLGALVLVLLVIASYWPVFRAQFVWDDALLVSGNPLVQGKLNLHSVWFHTDFPLTLTAFWLQWLAWGNHSAGYHIVNMALHALNAFLVWRVLSRLRVPGCFLAGVLFAVHPVCAASVAWISEQKNTLSLVFFLLSLLWYLKSEMSRRAPGWYWLSIGAFLLALLAKTSTVMLPVVLLILAWWQRGGITRRDILRSAPFFCLALAMGILTIVFQTHMIAGGDPAQTENFGGRLAGAGMALWFYLGKALLPLNLSMIYPQWRIQSGSILDYAPVALWIGLLGWLWRCRSCWARPILVALVSFTVLLFPVLGFFDMYFLALSRVSDHFQYLPMIAIIALVAAGIVRLVILPYQLFASGNAEAGRLQACDTAECNSALRRGDEAPRAHSLKKAATAAFGVVVAALSVLTTQRAKVFSSDESLWRDTLDRNPGSWSAHNNLGCIYAEKKEIAAAKREFFASLAINPRNADAHCNLARALSIEGKFPEAQPEFLKAIEIKPGKAEFQEAYGSALAGHGEIGEALKHLRRAVELDSGTSARLNYARALYQARDFQPAVAQYREVLSKNPNQLEALNNLGWILATCSDASVRNGTEAVQLAERGWKLSGLKEAKAAGTLAAAYAEAGRFADAVASARTAVELATNAGDAPFAAINRQLLDLYKSGRAYHDAEARSGASEEHR